jgi:hypothetical protein
MPANYPYGPEARAARKCPMKTVSGVLRVGQLVLRLRVPGSGKMIGCV